jgi:membrane protease YdiL (CAAX protease family)
MAGIELYAPRLAKHRRTWSVAAFFLTILFVIFIGQLPVAITIILMKLPAMPGVDWKVDTLLLAGFAPTAILFFLWVWLFERRGLSTIGFNSDGPKRYLRGLLLGLGFAAAAVCGIALAGGYKIESAGFWAAPTLALFIPIVAVFVGFVIQGATEEIAMRGYLMQVIASRHGIYWGIGISMVLFSGLHAINIPMSNELVMGLTNIVLVGIFFSLYAIKERSLWGVCAWHSAWNWLLGVGFGVEVSGQKLDVSPVVIDLVDTGAPWWITGGKFGPEGSIIVTVILIAGIAYQIWKGALKPQSYPVIAADEVA